MPRFTLFSNMHITGMVLPNLIGHSVLESLGLWLHLESGDLPGILGEVGTTVDQSFQTTTVFQEAVPRQ